MEIKVQSEDLLTVPLAAKQLGKPKMTLYRWVHATPPKINYVQLGGVFFIPKSEVERLLALQKENHREETSPVVRQGGIEAAGPL